MNDSDQVSVTEAPLMGKLTPRLLRTLSSESNLQTISLGSSGENDSLATISLAEIGGIPHSGAAAPLDPNLLIGLSPETLSVMSAPFQFLPSTSSQNELSIGNGDLPSSSVGDLETLAITRSSTDRDTITTCVTNTHPVTSCLSSFSSDSICLGKDVKNSVSSAIQLETDGMCSDPNVVTIMNNAIVRNSQVVSAMHCEQSTEETHDEVNDQQALGADSNRPLNLFENSDLESGCHTLNASSVEGPQGEDETDGPVQVQAFLSDAPGTSHDSMNSVVTIARPSGKKVCTSSSLMNLSNPVEGVPECTSQITSAETHTTDSPEGQSSILSSSENNVQYVSITVPNVEINSSGQLVISHVSLLQAPQSSNFLPLVTQSVEAPIISQTVVPDSTSEGLTPKSTKRKGGWPKGKKRKVNAVEAAQVPKAPTTSYMMFFRENRERIEKENETLAFKDLLKVIGNKWATLTEEERKVYTDKAAKQKKRYLSEVKSHAQTEAYQTLIRKEAIRRLNNSEGDFPGSEGLFLMGDFSLMEEDPLNPNELYCKVCDQYFSTIHNKKEHLSGRQHVKTVGEKLYSYSQQQQQQPTDPIPQPDSLEGFEEMVKKDLTSLDGIRAEIMELHAHRELEVKNLRREATDNVMKNVQLTRELKDLQDTYNKLEGDIKNLKAIESSLHTKLNGLRLLMTLFGVMNFS
ncbi:High mobility group protein 20A [Holothuria leucospilota]|uniref:High mobility group protein 20A n=1 Tax=Holothuria leucospilota TaxID=206669 RepID=A0A9Q0YMT3_HOLLE|nr:High mobility group protein 20A [Holothuria leucospilota]